MASVLHGCACTTLRVRAALPKVDKRPAPRAELDHHHEEALSYNNHRCTHGSGKAVLHCSGLAPVRPNTSRTPIDAYDSD